MISKEATLQRRNAERLAELEHGATTATALALFDALPAVALDDMLGSWRGSSLATGHPLDGVLERFRWHGKRFEGREDVHPLVFDGPAETVFSINPSVLPIGVAIRYAALLKLPLVARTLRLFLGVLRTQKPQARLRMTECRGVSTATMIYDALPINDVFRMIDHNTLLAIMDVRGETHPFVFVLKRESARSSATLARANGEYIWQRFLLLCVRSRRLHTGR